ncbi:MAG: lysoplasmalogenase [Chitinophagales bacterium]
MKTHKLLPFALLFSLLTAIHIVISSFSNTASLEYITKPLLMFVLGIYFHQSTPKPLSLLSKTMLIALFFSWLGDVLLMFQKYSELYFLLGLVSFLFAHVCYIFAFTKTLKSTKGSTKIVGFAILIYFAIGIGLISYLKEGLGEMLIPVIIYSFTIILMNIMSASRYEKVSPSSFRWVMIGAISFLVSDSLIAIHKFHAPIAASGLWIMATYCLGQYLIVVGILKQLWSDKLDR